MVFCIESIVLLDFYILSIAVFARMIDFTLEFKIPGIFSPIKVYCLVLLSGESIISVLYSILCSKFFYDSFKL